MTSTTETPNWTLDPRWIEHRDAHAAVNLGLDAPVGAHERYRQSIPAYVDYLAEITPPVARKPMMRALLEEMSLGVILAGFRATAEEAEYLRDLPVLEPEPVDEIDRLQRLPYGLYLRSEHWQKVRREALRAAGQRCQLCAIPTGLEVHHRTYARRGCERPSDVIVLCADCHGRHHGHLKVS